MKKENSSWALIAPIVVLVLIGTIVTAALAVTNKITAPIIAEQQAKAAEAAKRVVLPNGSDFAPVTDVEGLPAEVISVDKAGNGAGYVITTETKGFGGVVQAMFGVDPDGAITGSKVLKQEETQGIGSKVVEDGSAYQQQLIGMTDTSNIQAVSGASVSSNAMKNAVQAAFNAYIVLSGGTIEAPVYACPATLTPEALAEFYPGVTFTDVVGGKTSDKGTVVYAGAEGFGGMMVPVAVCFDENDNILGLVVDASTQTQGIGTVAAEPAYLDQFAGVKSGDDVDVCAGATFTSTAIKDSVNIAIANLETVKAAPVTDAPVLAPVVTPAPAEAADPDEALAEFYPGVSFTDVPDGKTSDKGTVVYASAEGFGGGMVNVTVCFDEKDNILGLTVDASTQTQGIGTMAAEPAYLDQFAGVKSGDDVDVCSGATFTSTAIKNAVNIAIENLADVKAGKGLPASANEEEPVESIAPAADDVEITTSAQGFGGTVTVTVTFGSDGVIKGLTVKTPSETPGLGARCSESSFTNKFIGAKSADGVDAIAGATVTSTAVKNAVNATVKAFKEGKSGTIAPVAAETPAPVETPAPAADDVTIVATAQGLLSQVKATVTFGADGAIKGLTVDASGETQGIGSRAAESSYTGKFIGAKNADGVDAIAGATVTSTAVKAAVNAAVNAFKSGNPGPVSAAGTSVPAETPAPVETIIPVETPAPEAPSEAPAAGPKTITSSAQGLLSTVNVTVTFDANGVITALSVDASGETPALGGQCAQSDFTSKFIGATNGDGVDAISGSTITSDAVKTAVNSAAAQFKSN